MKEKILSITKKHFIWDCVRGSGKGGQKKNKTSNAVRCRHIESGAIGWCDEGRSQSKNKRKAFEKCVHSKEFQTWLKLQIAKRNMDLQIMEEELNNWMQDKHLKIESFIPNNEKL